MICLLSSLKLKPDTFQIADLANEDTPQLYTLCGRGPRSSLRVLRHGLEVINVVSTPDKKGQ